MSERLGHVALEKDRRSLLATDQPYYGAERHDYSDETAAAIDEEVKRIVDETFERTVALLTERRKLLDRTAKSLLEKETLTESDLVSLTRKSKAPAPSAPEMGDSGPAARQM
jgi:cell division protease FtsH